MKYFRLDISENLKQNFPRPPDDRIASSIFYANESFDLCDVLDENDEYVGWYIACENTPRDLLVYGAYWVEIDPRDYALELLDVTIRKTKGSKDE